jgi:predicted nuclease of predicted toxin-antitoxin system
MKLLFDENLSPRLPSLLMAVFPDSVHARDCGLRGQSDEDVWEYARTRGFTIISKDSDFQQRGLLYGYPPKVVWLRIGNCSRQQLVDLIASHENEIRDLDEDQHESVLVLS